MISGWTLGKLLLQDNAQFQSLATLLLMISPLFLAWCVVAFVIRNMYTRKSTKAFGLFPSFSELHSAWMYVHH